MFRSPGQIRMAQFFRSSSTWVITFRFDGKDRVWLKAFDDRLQAAQVSDRVVRSLRELYGDRAVLVEVRLATEEEDLQFIRGNGPVNAFCRM